MRTSDISLKWHHILLLWISLESSVFNARHRWNSRWKVGPSFTKSQAVIHSHVLLISFRPLLSKGAYFEEHCDSNNSSRVGASMESNISQRRGPFCDELDKIIRTRDAVFAESAWNLLRRGGAISNQPKRLVAQIPRHILGTASTKTSYIAHTL